MTRMTPAQLSEAYSLLRELLLDHPLTAEMIAELNGGQTTARRDLADELCYAASVEPGEGGGRMLTVSVEAIGNVIQAQLKVDGPELPRSLPAEDPESALAALFCRGVDAGDLEEKAAYVENMETLISTLS